MTQAFHSKRLKYSILSAMRIETTFGHFDDASREYVITDPMTPWPWINYLGNEDFFSLWTTAEDISISMTTGLCGLPAGNHARHRWISMSAAME